jgi:hypothetical protein
LIEREGLSNPPFEAIIAIFTIIEIIIKEPKTKITLFLPDNLANIED